MDKIRPILYGLLAFIVFILWTDWQHRPLLTHAPLVNSSSLPPVPLTTQPRLVAHPSTSTPTPVVVSSTDIGQPVVVQTHNYRATLNTRGADITSLVLTQYLSSPPLKGHYVLLRAQHMSPFVNENGLLGHQRYPNQNSLYTIAHHHYVLTPGHTHLRVVFGWTHGSLQITKTYVFTRGSYLVRVIYTIHNASAVARHVYLYNQFIHGPAPVTHFYSSAPIYIGGAFYTPTHKYEKVPFTDMARHPLHRVAHGGWVAVSQHYFVAAAIPSPGSTNIFYSAAIAHHQYLLGYKTQSAQIVAPGDTATLSSTLFLGPKKPSLLAAAAPGLRLTVDYGWLTVLAQPLYWVLAHIEHVTGNWGWAIILLTILIKIIFFPLSAASFKSMAKMRKLQPQMAALKERHGSDRGALQQAMMDLYKQEKMNPLGGCLPMVVQIPVFIALYWVLLESVALRDAPFIFWLHNLAAPDPYFVLPILMGATMLGQQLLNPAMMDPTQRKIMMVMPVVFTAFFLFFPAGLVLYWVTNNLLSILQQWWVMNRMEKTPTKV